MSGALQSNQSLLGFLSLWEIRISPKRKVVDITAEGKKALFGAVKDTVKLAIQKNGRKAERDIFDNPAKTHRSWTGMPSENPARTVEPPSRRSAISAVRVISVPNVRTKCGKLS